MPKMGLPGIFNYFLLAVLLLLGDIQGEKTDRNSALSHKFYQTINGVLPCFRRMNGTHQIGCSTSSNGDVGVLHLVDELTEEEDMEYVLNKGDHAPYVVLMYLPTFRVDIMKKLNNPKRVTGVLILEKNSTREIKEFSTEKTCPNERYGFYNKTSPHVCEKWNPPGSSLLFQDWDIGIIYIQGVDQGELLLDCYEKFNAPENGTARDWPLCAAQLKAHMIAAVDSPTCVRRNALSTSVWSMSPKSVCDPVGGVNILSPLAPRSQANPYPPSEEGSVIVIATRLDSSSMFDKFSPGADSSATGLTALLALAKQLQPLKAYLPSSEIANVYFVIFNGEAFDYIGSSRVVYDMMSDKFPGEKKENSSNHPALLRLKDIKYFIELDQLAQYNNNSKPTYYVHRNWDSKVGSEGALKLVQILLEQGHSSDIDVNITPVQNGLHWRGLPPSSLQTFLAKKSNLTGIVITNHDDKGYANKFYNSILDDDQNIGYNRSDNATGATVEGIASLVAAIGRTVEMLISPNASNNISKDVKLVDDILYCYVESANCPLFLHLRKDETKVVERTFPLYAGVFGRYARFTLASDATAKLLSYWMGEVVKKDEEDCKHDSDKPIFDFLWLNGSCYNTSVLITPAQSPAFTIEDYDWSSGEYSTWTESSWNHFSVRIYLKPSLAHDLFTLFLGLVVFIISSILIWWVNEKAEFIFESRGEQIC